MSLLRQRPRGRGEQDEAIFQLPSSERGVLVVTSGERLYGLAILVSPNRKNARKTRQALSRSAAVGAAVK